MKKVKQLSLIALLSVFVFSVSTVNAQNGMGMGPNQSQGIENAIPDLTDKQKEDINTLRTAHIKEVQQIKNQMDIKRAELKALQSVENPDLDAINKKIEEKAALRTELEKKSVSFKQDVRALLTDDQKVIYDQKMSRYGKAQNCSGNKSGHNCGHSCGGKGNKPACKK